MILNLQYKFTLNYYNLFNSECITLKIRIVEGRQTYLHYPYCKVIVEYRASNMQLDVETRNSLLTDKYREI